MDWSAAPLDSDTAALGKAVVQLAPEFGFTERMLAEASNHALGEAQAWRRIFPKGARDAIWCISRVSDASMKAVYLDLPADTLSAVIAERFQQNQRLKPFVRKVMGFDLIHPWQALARMQRTARVMNECLPASSPRSSLAALNLGYTIIVFIWLMDQSRDDAATARATRIAMRLIGQR